MEEKMKTLSKAIVAALVFGGSISAASAAGVITNVTASGPGLGSFNEGVIGTDRTLDFTKVFDSVNPISLTFTVAHADTGPANPYAVTEAVTNNTGVNWTDFHFNVTEPTQGGQGDVFTDFSHSTLGGFTLDPANASGPRNLNFTGALATGGTTNASFTLSPFDPGSGNTSTFTISQVPTIPEPETYAMLLAGLVLMGAIAKRRNDKLQG
jgi:hypothetical protein